MSKSRLSFRSVLAIFTFLNFSSFYLEAAETDSISYSKIRLIPESRFEETVTFSSSPMDAETFAKYSLIASGADEESTASCMEKLHSHWDFFSKIIKNKGLSQSSQKDELVRQALSFIHSDIFLSYQALQTRTDTALEKGTFNCVSATIIFMYFMKKLGIPVSGVECPNHAFAIVQIDGKNIDVETTNGYGFNPGTKIELQSAKQDQKILVKIPAKNYQNRKTVDDRRILSLIILNRISLLQKSHNDIDTIPLAVDQAYLQGFLTSGGTINEKIYGDVNEIKTSESNPVSEIKKCTANLVADFERNSSCRELLDFTLLIQEKFGENKSLKTNIDYVLTSEANRLFKENKGDEALALLDDYKNAGNPSEIQEIRRITVANILVSSVEKSDYENSIKEIQKNKNDLEKKDYIQLLTYACTKEATRISGNDSLENLLNAIKFSDERCLEFPQCSGIKEQNAVLRHNYEAQVHNKIAVLANSKKFLEAKELCKTELSKIGKSQILSNDLKRLESMR